MIEHRRLLVVGASSGIGLAVATAGEAAGARVVGAARRVEPIADAGIPAVRCDAREPGDCAAAVQQAVDLLGGLDGLVYASGVAPLAPTVDTDAAQWDELLRTNLVGAALVASAALPHLAAASGAVVFCGSHSVARPWPGLVPYAASKAALAALSDGLQAEWPQVRFACLGVEPTVTAFAEGWDVQLAQSYFVRWQAEGYWLADVATAQETATKVLAALG